MPAMQSRSFIGATLFFAFIVMLVSSFLLFSKQHSKLIALIHTLIGFAMVLTLLWHIVKNYKPLGQYLNPLKKHQGKINLAFPIALLFIGYLIASPFLRLSPAMDIYRLGQTLKAADKGNDDTELTFIERQIEMVDAAGQSVTIELKKGPYFMWPQYAIWLETLSGEFVQPLYVTRSIATNNFTNKVTKKDPNQVFNSHLLMGPTPIAGSALQGSEDPDSKDTRMRPESLPVFLHQLAAKSSNGYFVPTDNRLEVDGFSGATMTDNFIYTITLPETLRGQYRLRLEINHSFDFNKYYSSDRFPDDEIYSGDGFSAQPSVIYESVIDFDQPDNLNQMALIGHGHHSGKDGAIYPDTSNLTTALALVDRVLVSIKDQPIQTASTR